VDELRKWTERNPIQPKQSDKPWRDKNFQALQQRDGRNRGCVYCEKQDHKSVDCKTVATVDNRKRVLSSKCVSIAPETNTELTIARAVPRARFVRDITPPYAAALVTS